MSRDLVREAGRERAAGARHRRLVKEAKGVAAGPAACSSARPPAPGGADGAAYPSSAQPVLTAAPAPRPEDVTGALGVLLNAVAERIAEHGTATERPPSTPCTTPRGGRRRARRLPSSTGTVPRRRGCAPSVCCTVWCWASSVPRTARGCSTGSGAGVPASRPTGSREQLTRAPSSTARARAPLARAVGRLSAVPRWHPDGGRNDLAERARHEPVGGGGRPPARAPADRGRRQPAATGSAAARAGPCWPSCSWPSGRRRGPGSPRCCSPRPTTRCARCAGASPRYDGGSGPGAVLDGDPVQLTLPPGASVDVDVLVHGHWNEALQLPGLGLDLLDGVAIAHAEPFEAWLLSQRRRLSAAAESIVHEAALGLLARGRAGTGARAGRPGDRDEPAGREPPGAADPHLPAGR